MMQQLCESHESGVQATVVNIMNDIVLGEETYKCHVHGTYLKVNNMHISVYSLSYFWISPLFHIEV